MDYMGYVHLYRRHQHDIGRLDVWNMVHGVSYYSSRV